jgi:ribosomal protein S8E
MHCGWKRKTAIFAVLKQLGITETVSGFEKQEPVAQLPPVELPPDFQTLDRVYDDLDKQARKYVLDRGVTKEQISDNKVGVSFTGRYAYRILFPVFEGASLKGINARDFTGQAKVKYLNNPGDKYLYRFDSTAKVCVFSEGVFKSLRIAQVTEHNSVSLLGHDLTETQARQITDSVCERVILYPDTDVVGLKGMIRVADQIAELERAVTVEIAYPVAVPADEAPLEDIRSLLLSAVPDSWAIRQRIRV